ncbi:hypothetical protein [Paenibacillus thermotolerans]|uniref:hypothetical protein n=1 Tax=Paenibacillus thermotolerans TaxID=3027807 RepID=UPI002367DD53|nr:MULTISPECIES: hypothetical protein [unclassified Paenibacillus]
MGALLFTKEEMTAFLIKHIQEKEPSIRFEPKEEELLYTIRFEGYQEDLAVMNFNNIWTAYSRTNDLNCVIEGLNAQVKALSMSRSLQEDWQGFREEHVYPVLRHKLYAPDRRGERDGLLTDATVEGLDTMFLERRDGICLLLSKQMVPPGEQARWKRIAYDNVRAKGWVPPAESFPALNFWEGGTMHVFYGADHPFQLQFFLKELREKGMPSSFLVGFPSYDMAIALTVDGGIAKAKTAKEIALRSGLAKYMRAMYLQEPRPLSVNVYWVNGEHKSCVLREPAHASNKKTG